MNSRKVNLTPIRFLYEWSSHASERWAPLERFVQEIEHLVEDSMHVDFPQYTQIDAFRSQNIKLEVMMQLLVLFILLVALPAYGEVASQDVLKKDNIKLSTSYLKNDSSDIAEKCMQQVVAGKTSEGLTDYFSTNPLAKQREQQFVYLLSQIETLYKVFGKPFAYELAFDEALTESVRRVVYITKHESHVLTWQFILYKPKDKWIADGFNIDDDLSHLIRKK